MRSVQQFAGCSFQPGFANFVRAEWGDGVVDELAAYIARTQPGLRGFTRANLFAGGSSTRPTAPRKKSHTGATIALDTQSRHFGPK